MKSQHKGHLAIPNHSPQQASKFYAEAADCGFSAEEVKRRAKDRFKLSCFNELTSSQMNELIEKLIQVHNKQLLKKHV